MYLGPLVRTRPYFCEAAHLLDLSFSISEGEFPPKSTPVPLPPPPYSACRWSLQVFHALFDLQTPARLSLLEIHFPQNCCGTKLLAVCRHLPFSLFFWVQDLHEMLAGFGSCARLLLPLPSPFCLMRFFPLSSGSSSAVCSLVFQDLVFIGRR